MKEKEQHAVTGTQNSHQGQGRFQKAVERIANAAGKVIDVLIPPEKSNDPLDWSGEHSYYLTKRSNEHDAAGKIAQVHKEDDRAREKH
ncbi:MAG: hypothetical protein HZC28_11340 [Spirochaetes bacterium]|nr:hypothetical protein [Spirochaetota bacterium]